MPATFPTTLAQCPVCKKADPYTHEAPYCPRCGCDLAKSGAVHAIACLHTIAAAASLRAGAYQNALDHADYAWSLSRIPSLPPLACLAAFHSRRLSDLARWRTRLTTVSALRSVLVNQTHSTP